MFIIFLLLGNIITSNQSGFIFGDSAINQLVNISNDFGRALDSGKGIRVVFCDISKAFSVNILSNSLRQYKHEYVQTIRMNH